GPSLGIALALFAMVAGSIGLWTFGDRLRERMQHSITQNQKTRGWAAGIKLAADYPLVGVGRGAFESPGAAYRADDEVVRLGFPESLPIEMASEWGVPVSIALIALCALGAVPLIKATAGLEAGTLGAAAGVIAVVAHEMADFGLEILGVALPTALA